MKKIRWGEKILCKYCTNCCPNCLIESHNPLERISRNKYDKLFEDMTLRIFNFKRYRCNSCNWEGLRCERTEM